MTRQNPDLLCSDGNRGERIDAISETAVMVNRAFFDSGGFMTDHPAGYFQRIGAGRYRPTRHAGGAWSDNELHMAPVAGAIADAIEQFIGSRASRSMTVARLSFDILGMLPATEFDVDVRVIRRGRTIELLEAIMASDGRPAVVTRAWLLAHYDTSEVAGGQAHRLPHPDTLTVGHLTGDWPGGYISSLDVRYCGEPSPGRGQAWVSTDIDLIDGQQASDLARFVGLVDTANGVAVRQSPTNWIFPNVDLTIHLHRQPRGRWVGLDTSVTFGSEGHGLTSTILHDLNGPVGMAEQILTVRPRS
jgi:hypothetical protein